jgi:hypothetical protein
MQADAPIQADDDEFLAYLDARRRQNGRRFAIAIGVLLVGPYLPQLLAAWRVLSNEVAGSISIVFAVLLLGAWQAWLGMVARPEGATREERAAHLRKLVFFGAGVIVGLFVVAGVTFALGGIDGSGIAGTFLLVMLMGMTSIRAFIARAVRS